VNSELKNVNSKFKLPRPLPIQVEELEVLSPRDKRSISQWATDERVLSAKTTNIAGRWSNEYVPFAVQIMDWLCDATTREVWLQKCAQSSGSEIGLNFFGHAVEEDPMPFGIIMPKEKEANKRMRVRFRPLFESMPSLLHHLPGGDLSRLNVGQETELDNMIMYLLWATVASALADVALGKAWLDEAAKYQAEVGKEADSFNLIRDRLTTYYARSKLYSPSTPVLVGDMFDVEYQETDKHQWWVKCAHCGQRHVQKWKYVELQKDSARNLLSHKDYLLGDCAHYVCPECGTLWDEKHRWAAVCDGRWAPRDCKVDPEGRIVGKIFSNPHKGAHIHGMMLYPGFMTTGRMAAEWAKAQAAKKTGNIKPLQNFVNSRLGEPWEEREKVTDEARLVKHLGSYRSRTVPVGVQILTAGVDVQLDHVWVKVLGWGYMSEVWSIVEERLETGVTNALENFDILRQFLAADWPLADDPDKIMHISLAALDCNYRPDTVFDFCRRCTETKIIPVRGDDSVRNKMFRATKVAGGTLIRYDLNVNDIKNRLFRLLYESSLPGPGYYHLHAETTEDTLSQLCSEEQRRIRRRRNSEIVWVVKSSHRANHLWDCDVYATFAGDLAGARTLPDPSKPVPVQKRRVGQLNKFRK